MDALEAMLARRSIRTFTEEPVTREEVETLLRAAMAAPSAFNEQPWRFVVVRDRTALVRLSEATPYAKPMAGAAVGIVVCADPEAERHPGLGYWAVDCSAAMTNLLTAAVAIGLAGVWLGIHPWEDRAANVRAVLGTPESLPLLGMAAIGRAAETKEPAGRFEPAWVHDERW